jgi:hypothetical protein
MRSSWRAVAVLLLSAVFTVRAGAQATPAAQPAAPAAAAQDGQGPTVEATIGTAVQDRSLQGESETFPASVGTVYCYTKIGKTRAGDAVEHVWYHGSDEVGRVKLNIGASPWRTWSSKVVPPEATGAWHVDVVQDGKVLKTVAFKVQ